MHYATTSAWCGGGWFRRSRWKEQPACQHHHRKCRVASRKHPCWCLEKQYFTQPESDEITVVSHLTRLQPKPHLQRRQRANNPQPRFRHHIPNRSKMKQAEPPVSHPSPLQKTADDDKQQANDHEHDKRKVQYQHGVGKLLVRHGAERLNSFNAVP